MSVQLSQDALKLSKSNQVKFSEAQAALSNTAANDSLQLEKGARTHGAAALDSAMPVDKESLKATFELFNRMSNDLSHSYKALEQQVAQLTTELDRVNKQREEERKQNEQVAAKWGSLLEVLPGGVLVLDRWGVVSQTNPAANELLECNPVGHKWLDVIQSCFSPRGDDFHEISLRSGKRVSLSTRSLSEEQGQIILLTDQTETRQLQDQVARDQRLSALGQMVSAMAHQIRTPLSAAMLYAENLKEGSLPAEKTQQFAEKIVNRLNSLENQVRDMLIFAKGNVKLTDKISIDTLVESVQEYTESILAPYDFEVDCVLNHQNAVLECNHQVLVGAICNLIQNAVHACETKLQQEGAASIKLVTFNDKDSLVINIIDNGTGIHADVIDRLKAAESFVTTKAQGTGLGLAVVRAVVSAHQGEFDIDSDQGRGTCITLKLPIQSSVADAGDERVGDIPAIRSASLNDPVHA